MDKMLVVVGVIALAAGACALAGGPCCPYAAPDSLLISLTTGRVELGEDDFFAAAESESEEEPPASKIYPTPKGNP
ncbi:hypothetical protein T484DRAFT_1835928 [Baffinella frigidus]|nr:hypothetical protein T484DRAFT_1835928 [Cryptophyta sp. CCMP2293]